MFSKRNQTFSFIAEEKERISRAAITNDYKRLESIHPSTIDRRPSTVVRLRQKPEFPPVRLGRANQPLLHLGVAPELGAKITDDLRVQRDRLAANLIESFHPDHVASDANDRGEEAVLVRVPASRGDDEGASRRRRSARRRSRRGGGDERDARGARARGERGRGKGLGEHDGGRSRARDDDVCGVEARARGEDDDAGETGRMSG